MNRYGAVDLAGNVKEWCWNRANSSHRYILGGGWDEPAYLFNDADARPPLERAANFGFRCVKYGDDDVVAKSEELVAYAARDFSREQPVTDDVFAAYRTLYRYDKSDLAVRLDGVDRVEPRLASREGVIRGRLRRRAGAGARVHPQGGRRCRIRPWCISRVRMSFPLRSSAEINTRPFDWVIKSGRILIYPIYKSTFERASEVTTDSPNLSNTYRNTSSPGPKMCGERWTIWRRALTSIVTASHSWV